MLSDRCYLVKCYEEERCQAIPARNADHAFKQKMAFVSPWLYEKGKKVGKVEPQLLSPTHDNSRFGIGDIMRSGHTNIFN